MDFTLVVPRLMLWRQSSISNPELSTMWVFPWSSFSKGSPTHSALALFLLRGTWTPRHTGAIVKRTTLRSFAVLWFSYQQIRCLNSRTTSQRCLLWSFLLSSWLESRAMFQETNRTISSLRGAKGSLSKCLSHTSGFKRRILFRTISGLAMPCFLCGGSKSKSLLSYWRKFLRWSSFTFLRW